MCCCCPGMILEYWLLMYLAANLKAILRMRISLKSMMQYCVLDRSHFFLKRLIFIKSQIISLLSKTKKHFRLLADKLFSPDRKLYFRKRSTHINKLDNREDLHQKHRLLRLDKVNSWVFVGRACRPHYSPFVKAPSSMEGC